ncbi:PP2C family protein-serine/threonine phosphatase [Gracilimonas sp. Q87]|uniref:PP2C family protein-serine/threonine phosphatase n=1 Tax=Gracilimonas sp. Q87 TaxID=3384766 RepID=UPI00398400F5
MQKGKKDFRDLLVVVIGIAGMICFFYALSGVHPLRIAEIDLPKNEILIKADSVLQSWQYQTQSFYPVATFESETGFLDTLQKKTGKKNLDELLRRSDIISGLPLFTWRINEVYSEEIENELTLELRLDTKGNVVAFSTNRSLILKQRPFNREAIQHVYENEIKNYSRLLEDSLITGLLDVQHLNGQAQNRSSRNVLPDQLRIFSDTPGSELFAEQLIWKHTDFYLDRSVWKNFELSRDSVQLVDETNIRYAKAFLSMTDPQTEISASLTLELLPAGSLMGLSYNLRPQLETADEELSDILESVALFLILVFVIWLFFIFYMRIKARAIDTRPAMIVAVLAGFAVPAFWILQFLNSFDFLLQVVDISQILNGMLFIGVMGAISAVAFFVLTAVSDSITRQYWPEKLRSWDLIRNGLFINKPIGWAIVNAIGIGGLLAGVTGLFLSVIPTAYISAGTELLSDQYFLPSIANLLITVMTVLLVIVSIYLIIGNQFKALLSKDYIILVLSAVLFGLMDVLPFNIEPDILNRGMRSAVGLLLGYFYLRYDFLTVVLGFFVYLNFLTTSKGWVINSSPDANTFYLFLLVLAFVAILGVYFVLKGSERKELPEYVPTYIEDQAKEQRVKQELSIARAVQHTFLPSKIQSLPGIDMAGICIPAQETGGDYYDMISLGEERVAIAIGDVSGKGIRAAFYMTFIKGVLHSLSALILSPVELLNQLNRLFNENATRGTFISMIYGIFEAKKRTFTFARAGHNPMLLVKNDASSEWIKPKGLGIGMAKGDNFIQCIEEAELKLKEGDVLILYTDGITEMLDAGGRFYGEERLKELVKNIRKSSSEQIMKSIVSDVNEFKGLAKQHDDMTLVIIKADASANQ